MIDIPNSDIRTLSHLQRSAIIRQAKRSRCLSTSLRAHIDGVESELVVRSGHSAQQHPDTIAEVRRILFLQLAEEASD